MMRDLPMLLLSVVISLSAFADNLYSHKIGDTTVTEGTVNGQRVRFYSNQIGGSTVTRGSVGGQSYFTFSQPMGNSVYTSGHIGNSRIGVSLSPLGGSTMSNGHIGDSRYQATTYGLGGSTITSGSIWQRPSASGGFGASEPPRRHIVTPLDPDYKPYRPQHLARPASFRADQPVSFHTGSFSSPARQDDLWSRRPSMTPAQTYSAARRAAEQHAQWKLQHDPMERKLYNEFMQKVYAQEAQMIANTFGSYSGGASSYGRSRQESTSWFGWLFWLICILTLCWWFWRHRRDLLKREFWIAERKRTSDRPVRKGSYSRLRH